VEARRPANFSLLRSTEETKPSARRKMGVLPVLFAILVAAGLVVLIAWQAAPWLTESSQSPPKAVVTQAQPPSPQPVPPPLPVVEQNKPSPMPPPETPTGSAPETGKTEAEGATLERGPIPAPVAADQHTRPALRQPAPDLSSSPYLKVSVATIPPDATAMLDNSPDTACTTPCALDAAPGQHTVSISRQGYQTEHRPVTVANAAVELPTIALRVPGGVLMLASVPTGARVLVNGTQSDQITPAKLVLRPGKYTIAIEKDGKRSSKEVEIQNGITQFEKIVMDN
jgi:serine/threonine-protein kinase